MNRAWKIGMSRVFLVLLGILLWSMARPDSAINAQGQDSRFLADNPSSDHLVINVDLVNVVFTITDHKGRYVTNV